MKTERSSEDPLLLDSGFHQLTSGRKRSGSPQPKRSQALQENITVMGQWSSSNRTPRSADQFSTQQEGYAQRKPSTPDRDTKTTNERYIPSVAVVIDGSRRIPQRGAAARHDDINKRRQDQIRHLERTLINRNMRIKEYQREQTELLRRLQQLESKHEQCESRKAKAEDALQKTLRKAGVMQIQLQECRDDLFRLQPLNEISDSTILGQYDQLIQQTASWVDELFSRIDDENAHREASGKLLHPLLKLEDACIQRLLTSSPNASEYWLRHCLHNVLQQEVFVEDTYLSCLPEELVDLIKITEYGMGTLVPKRDSATVDAWRSETLAALANHPEMRRARSAKALALAEQYRQEVVSMIPEACERQDNLHRLGEEIVMPAMELAQNIQLTLGRYYFYPRTDLIPTTERRLTLEHISGHTLIDISTRRTLKEDSPVIAADDGTIGEKLFVLEPGLLRRGRGENPDVLMRKAVYLVRLDRPLGKRHKGPMSLPKDVITVE